MIADENAPSCHGKGNLLRLALGREEHNEPRHHDDNSEEKIGGEHAPKHQRNADDAGGEIPLPAAFVFDVLGNRPGDEHAVIVLRCIFHKSYCNTSVRIL